MLQREIENRLGEYHDAYLGKHYRALRAVKKVQVNQDQVIIEIALGYPFNYIKQDLIGSLTTHLAPTIGSKSLDIRLLLQVEPHAGQSGIPAIPHIKNIIAIASGKGGVGKSTVATNLALALAEGGACVGILDADIYGPSQPAMLGTNGKKPAFEDKLLIPIKNHGIQSMSIGYLIDDAAAMVWRGPMVGKAMQQLLHDTKWGALDYLIIDLPPGTGDIQLTLAQKFPVTGALIVTTPQDLALLDVKRACEMFNKMQVPILGVIENMSGYHCSQCGFVEQIFGEGGGTKLAKQYDLSLLGVIPLNIKIREMTDNGFPPVVQVPESEVAKLFHQVALKMATKLALHTKDYSAKFPKIVVEQKK